MSPDPIGVKGGVNLYAYTENDPLNGTDPTGLENLGGYHDWLAKEASSRNPATRAKGEIGLFGLQLSSWYAAVAAGLGIGSWDGGYSSDSPSYASVTPDGLAAHAAATAALDRFGASLAVSRVFSATLANAGSGTILLAPEFETFFNNLYGVSQKMASDLNTCAACILGLAAVESLYYTDLHDVQLNNPWGMTNAGANDLTYGSVQAAAADWEAQQGWRFSGGGINTPALFISALQLSPGYNTVNPNYYTTLSSVISSVSARMGVYIGEHY